jgi:type IV pilus assembly protein PilV
VVDQSERHCVPVMRVVMRCNNEQGFSLLEGMLAAVLLGTGLLAMSAMQGIAFVKNVDSSELTRITTLASDMMERIQFNRRNVISYNGINTQSATNCNTISATTQPQARGDCLLWDSLVDGTQLQNVQGTVTVSDIIAPTALAQRNVTVTISWVGSLKSDSTVKRARSLTINRVVAPE